MKKIRLLHGGMTLVSDEDHAYLDNFKWRLGLDGYVIRLVHENGRYVNTVGMHKEVSRRMSIEADQSLHIDGDKLDNRRENLEVH